ncbi:MAG: M48 family metallopeptidase [Lentisphaeria bacterium]|nr:M48 family metallopeptidase [Lentisphaeria bacterium]
MVKTDGGVMKKYYSVPLLVSLAVLCASCSTVPLTGRSQLTFMPESQMVTMAVSQYEEVKNTTPISANKGQTAMVKNAGDRISRAVEEYMKANGMGDRIKHFQWEYNLFEKDEANAWAMPGGKIAFYTGIMDVCENETGVAVVMSHEVAHVVAKHGSERYSQNILAAAGGLAVGAATKDSENQAAWLAAYGVGANVGVLLPYSRHHESEADRMGLIFMAMAGYDPHAAVDFWKRMSDLSAGQSPPELLSTHPAHETRIERIQEALPEALKYYRKP